MMNEQNMLEVRNLTKHFKVGSKQIVHAVDGVSFTLKKGKTLGLVGESGCGKSTCARTIIRMYAPTSGQILLNGEDITELKQKQLKPYRKNMQMIFQDPYASLNARMTVRDIIAEPLIAHGVVRKKEDANELIYPMLERVGLTKEHSGRYAHEFSGGQRQRVGIARALMLQPDLVILQPRSPSCGKGIIYDGSFQNRRVEGDGMFVRLLLDEGIPVMTCGEFLEEVKPLSTKG